MALPPAAAPTPGAPPVPPPAIGAPMADAPMEEDAAEPEVVATILKNADGSYTLQKGDEPEEDLGAAPGAPPAEPTSEDFPDASALMRGLMGLLESTSGAEEAFVGAGKGDMGAPPAGGPPKPPMGM